MAKANLLDELKKRPLLCDGAMGTQLFQRGLAPGSCGEMWNVDRAEVVQGVHRAYREAGCDLITTNTFGASSSALKKHGLDGRAALLNRAGAEVASREGGAGVWVLGDIGPFGDFLEPLGEMKAEDLIEVFREQAVALCSGGAEAIIVETMSDPAELELAVKAAKLAGDVPVIATYAFADGGGGSFRTMMGAPVRDAVARAIGAGADVVGANCGSSLSLEDYISLASQLVAAAGGRPVIVQPNAGSPALIDGKLVYRAGPEDMAAAVPTLLKTGVRIVGGCCGTTPEHIRAMAAAMRGRGTG